MRKVLILITLLYTAAQAQVTNFSFTNRALTAAEVHSPGRGAQLWQGIAWDNAQAPQVPSGSTYDAAKIGYIRFNWYEMESTQGVYTLTGGYPSVEWWLRWYMDKGQTVGMGSVMPVCGGCDAALDGGTGAYPAYLHTLMQAEAVNSRDWKTSGGIWVPNWNSENYLSRLEALLDTLSKFINTQTYTPASGPFAGKTLYYKDIIEYVDIRGYGNYGEWHNAPYWTETPTGRTATSATLIRIIDAHKNKFPNFPLVALAATYDPADASITPNDVTHYAATQSNSWGKFGWRLDALGEYNHDSWLYNSTVLYSGVKMDTVIQNRWKYAPVTGEPIQGGGQYATGGPAYYALRSQIAKYHFYSFGNGNYPGGEASAAAFQDTINNAFKLAGYRYNLNGGYVSSTIYANTPFTVSLNIRNLGSAPLYNKRYKMKYQLTTFGDVVVKEFVSGFSPVFFLPSGSDSVVTETFNPGTITTQSNLKLKVILYDTANILPALDIAVTAPTRNGDGSYTLATGLASSSSAPPGLLRRYRIFRKVKTT